MSKKSILLLTSILSLSTFAASTIEFGVENEQYNSVYNTSDNLTPYVSFGTNPIPDSKLKLDFKYSYQDQYGKRRATTTNGKFKTKRDRFDFTASGYSYKNGDYTFSPKIGFRYDQFDINHDSNSNQTKRMFNLRLYPDMNYNLTQETSLYLSGFTGPLYYETKQEDRKGSGYVKGDLGTNKYWKDWAQELQLIGIRHRLPNKDTIWASLYNEYKYLENNYEYWRWQARVGYNWRTTDNLAINPFIRYDLHYKQENKADYRFDTTSSKQRDQKEVRIGSTASYKIDPSFTIVGEVYWQKAHVENYKGEKSDDKKRMFYKLGFRKAF